MSLIEVLLLCKSSHLTPCPAGAGVVALLALLIALDRFGTCLGSFSDWKWANLHSSLAACAVDVP